jgi:hypothetical protein
VCVRAYWRGALEIAQKNCDPRQFTFPRRISTLVGEFADSLGIEGVSLLGIQLAREDFIAVPRIVETERPAGNVQARPLTARRN